MGAAFGDAPVGNGHNAVGRADGAEPVGNDGMAEGVVSSLQGKGYNKDGGHVVPVFGVDATENAKTLIAEGAMTGTVKQDAEGMALAICETVQAISAGKTVGDALASVQDVRFSIASDCASKLYVAYAPYTGE